MRLVRKQMRRTCCWPEAPEASAQEAARAETRRRRGTRRTALPGACAGAGPAPRAGASGRLSVPRFCRLRRSSGGACASPGACAAPPAAGTTCHNPGSRSGTPRPSSACPRRPRCCAALLSGGPACRTRRPSCAASACANPGACAARPRWRTGARSRGTCAQHTACVCGVDGTRPGLALGCRGA